MTYLQTLTDKVAIGLSFLCAIHCLVLPLIIVLLPSIAALQLQNEAFHTWMLIAVIPTSIYALIMGCKQHKRFRLLILGIVAISILVIAALTEETLPNEILAKALTLIGAMMLAYGHFQNYRLCKHKKGCDCIAHSQEAS